MQYMKRLELLLSHDLKQVFVHALCMNSVLCPCPLAFPNSCGLPTDAQPTNEVYRSERFSFNFVNLFWQSQIHQHSSSKQISYLTFCLLSFDRYILLENTIFNNLNFQTR